MYLKSCTSHFKWVLCAYVTQRFLMLKRAVLLVTIVLHVVKCWCLVYECYEVQINVIAYQLPQQLIDDFLNFTFM